MPRARDRTRTMALLLTSGAALILLVLLLSLPLGPSEPSGGRSVGGHPLFGEAAPEFALTDFEGEPVRLSDLRGSPLLINFWATWCIPCREEFPLLAAAHDDYADDGLRIVGILHDDSVDGARRFASDLGAEWLMLDDPDDIAFEAYTVPGMPTSYFVDAEGIVRAFSLGGFSEAGLAAQLRTILPASALPTPARASEASPAETESGVAAASGDGALDHALIESPAG